jgi:octaheme c-type cytochrome (tetrathionate reductase family)
VSATLRTDYPDRLGKPFFTFGTLTLLIVMGVGFSFGITRLLLGLGTVTNLDNHSPWGIWIAFDVACGVALAAGGFTTAALVDIFGRKQFHGLLRPAILTAFLGYLWVAIALCFDLGRYWNIWRPIFNWQGNSVLFEVGMCVAVYLTVLSVEMAPPIFEGLKARIDSGEWGSRLLRRVEKPISTLSAWVRVVLPLFIVAGVVLSFMHQSSLGTLMLISPSKLDAFWNTPILPILFLMSAIMVGFPMVILESIYASISFGRKPEMELLAPLAGFIPWTTAAYGVVKIGDLIVRHGQLDVFAHPTATISLLVEILLGIVAPFLLLLNKTVRRSPGWLFFSASLIIFGVVLNRINVFLVGYNAPYATRAYFPSIGEIALSCAVVCSVVFCYRLFVTFFPILPAHAPAPETEPVRVRELREVTLSPFWTWTVRGIGVAFLLSFVVLYSLVHIAAIQVSANMVQGVERVKAALPAPAESTGGPTYPQRPEAYRNFYVLDSPLLNSKSDDYEPALFSHRIHDSLVGGDCGVCHHRYAAADDDRVGQDIKALHTSLDIELGGPCSACHDDMAQNPPQSCGRCHGLPGEPDDPSRIGLKGAYHRQCIGCHERQLTATSAPTGCAACHHPWTPDHSTLVAFKSKPGPQEVTRTCLSCHPKVGRDIRDILNSAPWRWNEYSSTLAGYEHRLNIGLSLMADNACLAIGPALQECASCHIAHGGVDPRFNYSDPANIDCLVCHDTTGSYRRELSKGGVPDPSLDLAAVAQSVGRPSRQACGSCHFATGGAFYSRHGDLEPALAEPPPDLDVHMGVLKMRCQDCHLTADHRIAGMSVAVPVSEGRANCEKCHGNAPHGVAGMLSRHLDDHIRAVACETCHIPSVARSSPTLVRRDYSEAGQDRPRTLSPSGMPQYDPKSGALTWGRDLVPAYLWYDGRRKASLTGAKIDPSTTVILNPPVGEKRNPAARIFPFQVYTAVQPYDQESNLLVMPKLLEDYWVNFDWSKANAGAMRSVELPCSGKYGFVETTMYSPIHHEVVPAKLALGCADCHSAEAVACVRCHKGAQGMDLPEHRRALYPEVQNRIDFKALGYPDDPALVGGRFYATFGRGTPPQ